MRRLIVGSVLVFLALAQWRCMVGATYSRERHAIARAVIDYDGPAPESSRQ